MRVAVFSRFPKDRDAPRGGVETVALALVRALEAIGDMDLHVVTLEAGLRELEVCSHGPTTIHRLPGSRWPQMLDILWGPGRRRLKRYLIDLAPDIVHLHETYALGLGELPMPDVFTVHGFDHANIPAEKRRMARLRSLLWWHIEARGLARQRYIISITPYVRQHIEPLTTARIFDIDNPINPVFFETARNEVPGRVFCAGWISPRKNTLGLIRALPRLVEGGVDVSLHLAGEQKDHAYARRVREAIDELGLSGRVRLLGRISPDDVRRELSEACLFALPALQENAPMAISEAMAAGLPIVSSNVCGMPFMIDEGRTGYLVDPEDTDSLAERMGRLLTDDGLRSTMGGAAREDALRRFHPDAVGRRTVEVYRRILGSSGVAS
ncbi:MAG: glycosyltransferase family 4 protein [Phycisphaerae bacterium]|nr:glycosyltransferase family 4 protein [Phycisphaerae bacterium]